MADRAPLPGAIFSCSIPNKALVHIYSFGDPNRVAIYRHGGYLALIPDGSQTARRFHRHVVRVTARIRMPGWELLYIADVLENDPALRCWVVVASSTDANPSTAIYDAINERNTALNEPLIMCQGDGHTCFGVTKPEFQALLYERLHLQQLPPDHRRILQDHHDAQSQARIANMPPQQVPHRPRAAPRTPPRRAANPVRQAPASTARRIRLQEAEIMLNPALLDGFILSSIESRGFKRLKTEEMTTLFDRFVNDDEALALIDNDAAMALVHNNDAAALVGNDAAMAPNNKNAVMAPDNENASMAPDNENASMAPDNENAAMAHADEVDGLFETEEVINGR